MKGNGKKMTGNEDWQNWPTAKFKNRQKINFNPDHFEKNVPAKF